ncbi:hypothetical protein DRJ19_03450 [Candidatus Woesearchaeota archaeon]|nr:MAG: hypothetical protein DRJ16_06100 [Candidatus Woesearchaeota archaeon]RLE42806.1 MAG: hypothetical protein DRJ19_03450 [Candidatus Woesearchaeota archaeon]
MTALAKAREAYFALAMASHLLVLSFFVEQPAYMAAFTSALSLPVVYTIRSYSDKEYSFKGKYFVVRRSLWERIIDWVILTAVALFAGSAFYVSMGYRSVTWYLAGFASAWVMRRVLFTFLNILDKKGFDVEEPTFMVPVGLVFGIVYAVILLPVLAMLA